MANIAGSLVGPLPSLCSASDPVTKRYDAGYYEGMMEADKAPPAFAGLQSCEASSATTATLHWNAASDQRSSRDMLWYDISWAHYEEHVFTVRRSVRGSEVMPVDWELLDPPIPCTYVVDELDAETTYYFKVRARDEAGNYDENDVEHSCTTPENTASKPIISNVLPAVGTTITVDQPFSFDVTDDSGRFRRILVAVRFANTGEEELIHDGDGFVGFYSALSSRSTLGLGFHYTVRRSGGWLGSPTFKVYAFDRTGNEA